MTSLERALGVVALAVLTASGSAHAEAPDGQPAPDVPLTTLEPAPPPITATEDPGVGPPLGPRRLVEPAGEEAWLRRTGFALSLGGGVVDFSNPTMKAATGMGGMWNLRATLGTRRYLAIEGSYIGSAQSIEGLGLAPGGTLWGNGGQGALRFNMFTDLRVQPFVFGGGAYVHYRLSSTTASPAMIATHANVFELPAGVGVAMYFGGFMLDLRGEYRWAWGERLIPGTQDIGGTGNGLNRWDVTANVGLEF